MLININEIRINEGRRATTPEAIDTITASIREVGMMNPITVTADHTLIAGLHRLEAAKRLGWTEIECSVSNMDALHTELAEIDENYETLHPETKAGAAQGEGMKRAAQGGDLADNLSVRTKPFAEDTADKLGVDARTVRRQVKIAKDLTPEAQSIIEDSGERVTQQNLSKLCRLDPEQQKEAAGQLVSGEVKSVDEYGKKPQQVIEPEKPGLDGGTVFMAEFEKCRERFLWQMDQFCNSFDANFLEMTDEQVSDLERQMDGIHTAMKKLLEQVKAIVSHAGEKKIA